MSGHWPAFQVSTAAGHLCGMQIKTFIRLRGCSQMFFFMMLRGTRGSHGEIMTMSLVEKKL